MFYGAVVKTVGNITFGLDTTISQACLENPKDGQATSLFIRYEGQKRLLAVLTLKKPSARIGLEFIIGEEVTFLVEGSGRVHLTGLEYGIDENSA
jgi:hypothetical protein